MARFPSGRLARSRSAPERRPTRDWSPATGRARAFALDGRRERCCQGRGDRRAHTDDGPARALEGVQRAGAKILKRAQDVLWGGYSGYFADRNGYPWEVAYNSHWKLDAEGRAVLPR
jgi:hypothetical protein